MSGCVCRRRWGAAEPEPCAWCHRGEKLRNSYTRVHEQARHAGDPDPHTAALRALAGPPPECRCAGMQTCGVCMGGGRD